VRVERFFAPEAFEPEERPLGVRADDREVDAEPLRAVEPDFRPELDPVRLVVEPRDREGRDRRGVSPSCVTTYAAVDAPSLTALPATAAPWAAVPATRAPIRPATRAPRVIVRAAVVTGRLVTTEAARRWTCSTMLILPVLLPPRAATQTCSPSGQRRKIRTASSNRRIR
jgi:hypothetical protein